MEPLSLSETTELEGGNSVSFGVEVEDIQANAGNDTICWFSNTDASNSEQSILQGLDEVISCRHDFKNKIQGLLRWRQGDKVPTTKTELEAQISIYDDSYNSLRENAIGSLSKAAKSRANYKQDRKSGMKKFGRKAQGFVKSFTDFLHAYSGIVELLRGAGQVYSEVAYETLSIFFIVVVNKSGNDTKMATLLIDLQRSIPQLDEWTNIYDTPPMKTLVVEVYKQIIDFTRTASIYFTQFSTRLWMAIGRPPSMGIDKTAANVHKKLAEVSSGAMIELHKRSQNIYKTVEDTRSTINRLERLNMVLVSAHERVEKEYREFRLAVELEKENEDQQNLERLKGKFQITYPSTSTNFAACSLNLGKAFPTKGLHHKSTYLSMTPEFVHSLPEWRSWIQDPEDFHVESSLLILAGKTVPEARAHANRGLGHSWVSPAAFHAVEYIRERGDRVAFYCCHPGLRQGVVVGNEKEIRHSAKEVLASLAYQILEWHPKSLRKKMAQIEAVLARPEWRPATAESERATLKTAFALLKEVLSGFQEAGARPIHLILDRVDLVEDCDLRYFMEELVDLVRDENLLVKVFVVMDTARQSWHPPDLDEERKVLFRKDLNQRKAPRPGLSWP